MFPRITLEYQKEKVSLGLTGWSIFGASEKKLPDVLMLCHY
jgi:hypothetical protein